MSRVAGSLGVYLTTSVFGSLRPETMGGLTSWVLGAGFETYHRFVVVFIWLWVKTLYPLPNRCQMDVYLPQNGAIGYAPWPFHPQPQEKPKTLIQSICQKRLFAVHEFAGMQAIQGFTHHLISYPTLRVPVERKESKGSSLFVLSLKRKEEEEEHMHLSNGQGYFYSIKEVTWATLTKFQLGSALISPQNAMTYLARMICGNTKGM